MPRRSADVNVMVRAAERAGRALIRDFGEVDQLQVSQKGPGDFVSAADLKAEKIVKEELKKGRPEFGFLMEESGRIGGSDKSHVWIIDPLDGTTNFLHGLPHFSVSIALSRDDEIIAGVVFDPLKDEVFWTERGIGAFVNNHRILLHDMTKLLSYRQYVLKVGRTILTGRSWKSKENNIRSFNSFGQTGGKAQTVLAQVALKN